LEIGTDEGIDARTTYHMMAVIFSPVIFWPLIAFTIAYNLVGFNYLIIIYLFLFMVSFHISNLIFLFGYDLWNDFMMATRRKKLSKSNDGNSLLKLISQASSNLDVLK